VVSRASPSRIAVAAALVAAGACTFPEVPIDPGEPVMIVHMVLDAGRDTQRVEVDFNDGAYPGTAPPTISATLTTPEGVPLPVTFLTRRVDDYRYSPAYMVGMVVLSATGRSIVPGGTYLLRVTSSDGHDVTGTTTVPNMQVAPRDPPTESFVWMRDTLRISGPTLTGAASYQLNIGRSYAQPNGQEFLHNEYRIFTSGTIAIAGTARTPREQKQMFEPGTLAVAMLAAVDVNYYDYFRVLSDPFTAAVPSGLTGGLGVFGSMVPVVVKRLSVK
jgi:hypothetical protein